MTARTYEPMIGVGDYLRLNAQRFPDRDCFVTEDGTRHSFTEVNARVNRLASSLAARGVTKGSRLAILAIDSVAYYEVVLASLKLGATYVPLNNRLTQAEVTTLLGRAEPTCVFASERYTEVARTAAEAVGGVRTLVALDGPGADGFEPYTDLVDQGEDVDPAVVVHDTDIVGLAFTSGTTGLPKGVLQSHGMIKALLSLQDNEYEYLPGEFRYTASPAFHIAGQALVLDHIKRGFTTLILPQFDDATTLRWIQEGGLTGCFLVPTMIRRILDLPNVREGDYSHFRSIIYGAAPMPPTLLTEAMAVFGCRFIQAFGASTEGGMQAILTSEDHVRALAGEAHLLGSIGRPISGVELRIVDVDDRDVEVGEVGEIITRSDAVMSCYLEMPEKTEESLKGGWFRAGDLARRDAEGFLYLAGRSKDMIIRGGENIYPIEIETVLMDLPGVASTAVVGRPDDYWGETVVAYLTVHEGAQLDPETVQAHCREHLARFKVPEEVLIVPEMPLNASGKILKRELRRFLVEGGPRAEVSEASAGVTA
ncbi:class I adenylate-forming enzyme family protein [Aeromicrobium alkaliterrae]|uniref:Fatty acid--CoA ligase n=1 Tax=Aeromicrobium alkaliterrae TaxID=302168 RepID=A0ABN2K1I2_9ACTN